MLEFIFLCIYCLALCGVFALLEKGIRWLGFISLIVFILMNCWMGIYYFTWTYPQKRDVWSKLNRAETSAEADTMLPLVDEALIVLEERGQDSGHCALITKTNENDLEAQYRSLENVKTRLERTIKFDKNSQEYQSAIDDIRGILRDMVYVDCWIWHFD